MLSFGQNFFFFYLKMVSLDNEDDYTRILKLQKKAFEAQFGTLESLGIYSLEPKKTKKLHDLDNLEDTPVFNKTKEEKIHDKNSKVPRIIEIKCINKFKEKDFKTNYSKKGTIPILKEIDYKNYEKESNPDSLTVSNDVDNSVLDLKLERLIQESHILQRSNLYSGCDITLKTLNCDKPIGNIKKTIFNQRMNEMRKKSFTNVAPKKLEKIPMIMRQNAIKKYKKRAQDFEENAKNSGIILSKIKKNTVRSLKLNNPSSLAMNLFSESSLKKSKKRLHGLKGNNLGSFKSGELILSQKDISRITEKKKV